MLGALRLPRRPRHWHMCTPNIYATASHFAIHVYNPVIAFAAQFQAADNRNKRVRYLGNNRLREKEN